jgi:hypothetical protein
MGAVGVGVLPRQGQRHRHRPAKLEPKSPFRFRSRGPCGIFATLLPACHCCPKATLLHPCHPPPPRLTAPHGPPRVRHAPDRGPGHPRAPAPAQRSQPRPGAPTGPSLRGFGRLVPLVSGVRGTVNVPRTWGLLTPRGRVAGLPTHSPHLSSARLSTRFPQCLRGVTA